MTRFIMRFRITTLMIWATIIKMDMKTLTKKLKKLNN
jgi:hypothetical protein